MHFFCWAQVGQDEAKREVLVVNLADEQLGLDRLGLEELQDYGT